MNLETYFAEAALRAVNHQPVRRRALKWPRLLARFNYREGRARGEGCARQTVGGEGRGNAAPRRLI